MSDPNESPLLFACDRCPKTFKKKNKLSRHIKETHLNLKEFTCSICNKSFKRNSHLKRHIVVHSSEPKPYKCLYVNCLLRFSDKYHLERHIKVKHKNIKFECSACGLSFDKKLFLFKHNFQSHNLDKPFKCEHNGCNKSFYTKGTLAKHTKHHEFPFKKTKKSQVVLSQVNTSEPLSEGLTIKLDSLINNHSYNGNDIPSPAKFLEGFKEELDYFDEESLGIKEFIKKEEINSNEFNNELKYENKVKNENLDEKNNEKEKKIKRNKKKRSHENHNFLFTCLETNCGKTYSTVKFIYYL